MSSGAREWFGRFSRQRAASLPIGSRWSLGRVIGSAGESASDCAPRPSLAVPIGCVLLTLLVVCARLAWVGDDAYITFRSVENWVVGNGLRWNVDDRVQTYTHPLWMLMLAAGRWLGGDLYHVAIAFGLACSMLAVASLLLRCRSPQAVLLAGLVLIGSPTFLDYSTSGLETGATYLLIVLFVGAVMRDGDASRGDVARDAAGGRAFSTVLLMAVAATNRMDLVLLCGPAALGVMRGGRWRTRFGAALLGALPLLAWLVFAVIYYGTVMPVTAHAKAFGLGISRAMLLRQGFRYVVQAARWDPVLVVTVCVGMFVGLRTARWRGLALGMPAYLAYVIWIGGDFMAGRFLLPPFVLAVAILSMQNHGGHRVRTVLAGIAIVALALANGRPGWASVPVPEGVPRLESGICDERRYYTGRNLWIARDALVAFGQWNQVPGWGAKGRNRPWVMQCGLAGIGGFGVGDRGHVIDPFLCDPLLARLPAWNPSEWRIGHVLRRVPEGYYESIATQSNRIVNPHLHRYYEALRNITAGPVFDPERWRAIWEMWSGRHDVELAEFVAEDYFTPPRQPVRAEELAAALPGGTCWFDEPRMRLIYEGGLAVTFPAPVSARELHVQVAGIPELRLRFFLGRVPMASAILRNADVLGEMPCLRDSVVPVPREASTFDLIWLDARAGNLSPAAIGALKPVD